MLPFHAARDAAETAAFKMIFAYTLLGVLALGVCLWAAPLGRRLGVMDLPDGIRKVHAGPTPMVGGFAIAIPVVLMAAYQGATTAMAPFYATLALLTAVFLVLGLVDDYAQIRPTWRLLVSFALCLLALKAVPAFEVTFLKFSFLSTALFLDGWTSLIFTLLCLVGLQNAVNMADGKNGLVIGMSLIWCLVLFAYAPTHLFPVLAILAVGLSIALAFNLAGRLFLGDSGTYSVSACIGALAVYCYHVNFPVMTADIVGLMFLIPVVDCLRLIVLRVSDGRSPFNSDSNHLHHLLERLMPWDRALSVYLAMVALPSLLTILWPGQTLSWTILALAIYAVAIGFCSRVVSAESRTTA
jgi:UDP-GlcNAc:undecaprenyl-phosphate GlcNAc-1-phosphate transferase